MSIERDSSPEVIVPQKFIVEIGCGDSPFVVTGLRRLKSNERYLGIDLRDSNYWGDHNPVEFALQKLNRSNPPQEGTYEVIEWDGRMVQLPDRSVDEVHFQNVMGDRNHLMSREALLKEGARILKRNGTLRVVEDDTPYLTPPSIIREIVKKYDMIQLNEGKEQDLEHLSQYSSYGLNYSSLAFIAEFGYAEPNIIPFRPRSSS